MLVFTGGTPKAQSSSGTCSASRSAGIVTQVCLTPSTPDHGVMGGSGTEALDGTTSGGFRLEPGTSSDVLNKRKRWRFTCCLPDISC